MALGIWGNRAGKAGILLAVGAVIFGTGYLANNGAAAPEPVAEKVPVPDLAPKTIKVAEGTIVARLVLKATVNADPAAPARPEKAGTVTRVLVKKGQRVNKGEAVVAFEHTPEPKAPAKPGTEPKPVKPVTLYLAAPATGRVQEIQAHVGSSVSPGEVAFSVDRGRFRAVAEVETKDIYRLYNKPRSVRLQIDHGPAPFACPLISYGAGGGEEGKVEISCRIPESRKVFPGLPAEMSVLTDQAKNVPVVPLAAVLGKAETGWVTVVGESGERTRREVELGLNDGKRIEIKSGLEVGEKILDLAPEDAAFAGPEKPKGHP
ncbi:efflux RND transporter periplasmic adaptor subunit [Actinocorallia populi]|uniref:efflux RND transporter periplasmic adaptor subunit n=1 Tax=Actinocorallia populi TaxID=2079200 RepID=UPI001300221C|nr:HlyD family efflux transporter periplasmic adaptor subunit [Actinocorallia populi]